MSRLLIQLSHIYKSFGSFLLFDDISLSINEGEIFALIGENGSGKTTLLRLLRGAFTPDSGRYSKASNLTLGFLPQEILSSQISAREYMDEDQLAVLEQKMASCLPEQLDEWAHLHEIYENLGGYRRLPLEKTLKALKLDISMLDISLSTLSSGQRVRMALAKALINNPDLLLLDEPTNHLDMEMLKWLEETLRQRKGATVIVSHDRKFINKTCNRLIEIKSGKLTYYGGSYDFYLDERDRIIENQIQAYDAQEEERRLLKQKIKAHTYSKGKSSPPKDRNIMAYDRRGENHQKSLQRNLDRLKARLDAIEANPLTHPKPKSIKGLRFPPSVNSGGIEIENIRKTYGDKTVFSGLTKKLSYGDRIILTGPNGCGKTTLLRCIAGLLQVDAGQIRYTSTTKIGYLDQDVDRLPLDKTPLQYFESRFNLCEEALRRELHKAAIGEAELLFRPFATLSVGQRKRLMVLALMLEKPNVLLLDEPTNHLDLLTLEAFEEALLQFEGIILAVSHDQTFKEKIATEIWNL